jgi:hypothetical protein
MQERRPVWPPFFVAASWHVARTRSGSRPVKSCDDVIVAGRRPQSGMSDPVQQACNFSDILNEFTSMASRFASCRQAASTFRPPVEAA